MKIDNVNIYIITHGRPNPSQRPTSVFLEMSGLDFYFVMNEKQVADYVAAGVDKSRIVVSTDEYEEEYFRTHKTYDVDFHGAICNREMCNIHARQNGVKYAVQLDDNIIVLSVAKRNVSPKDNEYFCREYLPKVIRIMRDICESTNIGMLGIGMGQATPNIETKILRNGYAYSFFMENVEANIHWRGPFDDDILHNLDFNHSGIYTNALLNAFGYAKETKSKTGMRKAYDKWVAIRPVGTANLYPDHVGVGIKPKANGRGMRFYHVFKQRLHQNIKIRDGKKFSEIMNEIRGIVAEWREYTDGKTTKGNKSGTV